MKTAVCLSGRLDAIESAQNIIDQIIKPYNADVFIDSWIPFANGSMKVNAEIPTDTKLIDINKYAEVYQPKTMNLEHFDTVPITHQIRSILPTNKMTAVGSVSHGTSAENVLFMWYKIWKSNQMRKLYEQTNRIRYDCVIRLRFDNTFNNFPIIDPKRKTVYIPKGGDYEGGICDQFALADPITMDLYAEMYNEIYRYTVAGVGIHPESMLRKHLEVNRLEIERFDCEFALRGRRQ